MRPPALLLLPPLLAACARTPPPASPVPPRNAVLVSVDGLRPDHLSAYGYDRPTTPTLDRLAREGVLFETVVADSPSTLPSTHTLLTGLSSLAHGVLADDRTLSAAHVTVADLLHAAGLRTLGVWSAPHLDPSFGFGRGFDAWVGATDLPALPAPGDPDRPRAILRADRRSRRDVTSPAVLERALELLDSAGDAPFFLFVHLSDVRHDYLPPEDHWRRFDPDWPGERDDLADFDGTRLLADPRLGRNPDARLRQHVVARYDGEVRWVDHHLGRLVDALERRGLADETLLLVTAAHGEELFERGGLGHGRSLHDELLLVPLVAWQGRSLEGGRRVRPQVRQLDLAPTLLDALGLPVPRHMRGTSLVPVLLDRGGATLPPPTPAVSHLGDPDAAGESWRSIRTLDRKVILHTSARGGDEYLFFDLRRDPGEQETLSALSKRTDTLFEDLSRIEWIDRGLRATLTGDLQVPPEVLRMVDKLGYAE